MRFETALFAAFSLLFVPSAVMASCQVDALHIHFGEDGAHHVVMRQNESCHFASQWGPGSRILSFQITQQAQHGIASASGGKDWTYKPQRGFAGSDQFVYTYVGASKQNSGTSNVTVSVDVAP